MRRSAGFSVAEALVALSVLALLTGMIALVYRTGSESWQRMDRRAAASQSALLAADKVATEVEQSVYDSLSIGAGGRAAAFLSAFDPSAGVFAFDASNGRPVWQRYVVLYHDPASAELRKVEVPLATATQTAQPLDSLEDHLAGGRVLARGITSLTFEGQNRMVVVEITCAGLERQAPVTLRSATAMRN